MEMEVTMGGEPIGKAEVLRQGLYYKIHCRCRLTGNVMYRLYVKGNSGEESLGVLVPLGSGFGLETRIPVKRVGEGELSFFVEPKHTASSGEFMLVYPEEPFSYISRLKDAYLEYRDGQPGLIFNKNGENREMQPKSDI